MIGDIARHVWHSVLDVGLFLVWTNRWNQAAARSAAIRRLMAAGLLWGLADLLSFVIAFPGQQAGIREWSLYLLLSLSLHAAALLVGAYALDFPLTRSRRPYWRPCLTKHRCMMEQLNRLVNKEIPFTVVLFQIHNLQDMKKRYGPDVCQSLLDTMSARIQGRLQADWRMSLSEDNLFWICVEGGTREELIEWKFITKCELVKPWMVRSKHFYAEVASSLVTYRGDEEGLAALVERALGSLRLPHPEHLGVAVQPDPEAARRAELTEHLRDALKLGQFSVHYQPQFDIRSGRVRGFEALLRWRHPEHGFISPAEFIPLTEASGLIVPLGMWVLRQACETGTSLLGVFPDAVMSVNVSAVQINDPDFPECVKEIARSAGLPPHRLELEVTETALMASLEYAQRQLMRLSQAGIILALDDFGVGYSSLNYLKKLPFHVVKIDKSFTNDLTTPKEAKVTEAIIQLVKHLDYRVVAEGVETFDQLNRLKEMDCDVAQGFLLSRPLAPEQLPAFIAKHLVHP